MSDEVWMPALVVFVLAFALIARFAYHDATNRAFRTWKRMWRARGKSPPAKKFSRVQEN